VALGLSATATWRALSATSGARPPAVAENGEPFPSLRPPDAVAREIDPEL